MFFYLVTSRHILPPFSLQLTAKHCLQKWKWWPTLVWPLLWGQMCLCDNFFPRSLPCFSKWGKTAKCQLSTARRVETHQPLLALTRHLCSLFLGVELARPQSWRDLAARAKNAEEGEARSMQDVGRSWPWNVHFVGGTLRGGCGLLLQGITASLHQARTRTTRRKRRGSL